MPRQECRTVYQFDELSDRAKERARDWYREASAADNFTLDEMIDSLQALFKVSGLPLKDWSIGPYSQGCRLETDLGDADKLTGARAMAWLENRLFSKLRITQMQYAANRKDYFGYGAGYRPGKVKPCPLTGVCYDEDLLDALRAAVKSGDTLKEAFEGLADEVRRMNEAEIEGANEDQEVDESIRANEYEFTEEGGRI